MTMHTNNGDNATDMTLTKGLSCFFEKNSIGFGAVDIFCLGPGKVYQRMCAIINVLLGFHDDDGHSPIQQFVLVLPSTITGESNKVAAMKKQLERLIIASERFPESKATSDDLLKFVVPPDLSSESVLAIVRNAIPMSVIIIAQAATFRAENVEPYSVHTTPKPLILAEDFWAPQLHALAKRLSDEIKEQDVYSILDAGQATPHRPELVSLLKSIDGVGVLGGSSVGGTNAMLAENVDRWSSWLSEGRLGPIMESIDAIPSMPRSEKSLLRIQVFHRAGLYGLALEEIESIEVDKSFDCFALTKLAKISADAGAALLARRLLAQAVNNLSTSEGLELALATATDIDDTDLAESITTRLEQFFPHSSALALRKVHKFVSTGNYGSAESALPNVESYSETRRIYSILAKNLGDDNVPDYVTLCDHLLADYPSLALQIFTALINDALRRGLVFHALDIAISTKQTNNLSREIVCLILGIIEQLMLDASYDLESDVESARLIGAVTEVVSYLSTHPSDSLIRVRLTRLLSFDVGGFRGLSLIVFVASDLFRQQLSLREKSSGGSFSAKDLLERRSFIKTAFSWMEAQSPLVLGRIVLPEELLTDPPDDLISAIPDVLVLMGQQLENDSDVGVLMSWLTLGVSLAPHTSDPDQDLSMIQLVAGQLSLAGKVQQARDLAEQALISSETSAKRKRKAWFTMADIYHRIGNNLESIIALACAGAGDSDIDSEHALFETNLVMRIMRDLSFFDFARDAHMRAGDILRGMELDEANQHRQDTMGLQIDMAQLLRTPDPLPAVLSGLLTKVLANATEVLERGDDPTPIAIMLGQLLPIAENRGTHIPLEAGTTLEALLERTSTSTSSLIRTVSSENPSADDLLALYQRSSGARYAEDVGFDMRNSVFTARRLLLGVTAEDDPVIAALAIEILADHAIATPGWETIAKPPELIATTMGPANIARKISSKGITVLMAGLDENENMVRVTAENGKLEAICRENEETFSAQEMHSWAKKFPFYYGLDEDTPNLFYQTTENLRISKLPKGRVLLITDTKLQQLPANLFRTKNGFAGSTRAMAAAPSLSWLAAARKEQVSTTGRVVAWISEAERHGQTLAMITSRLADTFLRHSVELNSEPTLPSGLAKSELVIVAAHGSISSEGRFFHSVSDEGDLKIGTVDFAGAFRNVGVVVLFVCSGGRIDAHPTASTTIGLVKQLLDRGCSAVVSSPWPLDPRVTYHWLPVFLDQWKNGALLIDANFEANLAVSQAFGNDPAKCLAMSVFGDPLRIFQH